MPLPFILAGVAIVAAGYGVKKGIDVLDADCEADEFIKKAEGLKEEAAKKAESAESDCRHAFARFGEKKLHVLSHSVSNFLDHFHRLNRSRIIIEGINMQDIQCQVSDAQKITNQYREVDFFDASGAVIAWLGGGALSVGGFGMVGGMAVLGGLVAGPALAILGAVSASKMEKKREEAKAYLSQVKAAVKKTDVIVDNLQAVRKMADLFTRQITKCDALFFSLSQDAIATMKKCNYDVSHYSQEEKDQLCVTVSTLSSLSAFLKVPIMDKHQKLNKKAQNALNLMRNQMDSLENGHYSLRDISFRQAQLEDLRDDKTS
ncbi:glycine zipper family protein [Helicobacter pylori]|nr:glycine zipper family protein [Helicobacter pylori]